MQNSTPQSFASSTDISSNQTGEGRGFYMGDMIVGETKNGLKSTTTSKYLIVNIPQGVLAGARMVFTPTVEYDTYVFESNEIQLGRHRAPIKAIIVTPNAELETGFRTDVDYHTMYKLGMLWVYGMSKGAAQLVTAFGNDVKSDNSTTVITSDYGTKELIIAGAGGVADAATDIVKKETSIPPTVTVGANEAVGIMFVENINPTWLPVVPDDEYSL